MSNALPSLTSRWSQNLYSWINTALWWCDRLFATVTDVAGEAGAENSLRHAHTHPHIGRHTLLHTPTHTHTQCAVFTFLNGKSTTNLLSRKTKLHHHGNHAQETCRITQTCCRLPRTAHSQKHARALTHSHNTIELIEIWYAMIKIHPSAPVNSEAQ